MRTGRPDGEAEFRLLFGDPASPNGALEGLSAQVLIRNAQERKLDYLRGEIRLDPVRPGNVILHDKEGAQHSINLADAEDFAVGVSQLPKSDFQNICRRRGMLETKDTLGLDLYDSSPQELAAALTGRQVAILYLGVGQFELKEGTVTGHDGSKVQLKTQDNEVVSIPLAGAETTVINGNFLAGLAVEDLSPVTLADFAKAQEKRDYLLNGSKDYDKAFGFWFDSQKLAGKSAAILLANGGQYELHEGIIQEGERGTALFGLKTADGTLDLNINFDTHLAIKP